MPYITSSEINEIVRNLMDDKYTYCASSTNTQQILSNTALTSFLLSSIERDIEQNKHFVPNLYLLVVSTLLQEKILTTKNWKRTSKEIKIMFDTNVGYCVTLIANKILPFSEFMVCYSDLVLSEKIMAYIKNTLTIIPTRSKLICNILEIMVVYDIPVNFEKFTGAEAISVLTSYYINCSLPNELFTNILKNYVSPMVFIDEFIGSSIERFWTSDNFYKEFENMHDNTIKQFANYITKSSRYYSNLRSVERLLEYADENDKNTRTFVSKFMILLPIIQKYVISDPLGINDYYSPILQLATVDELKKLHLNTIIAFDLANCYINDDDGICEILNFVTERDHIDIAFLRNKFSEYEHETVPISLLFMIRIILLTTKHDKITNDKIDLLFFFLEQAVYSTEEINDLIKIYSQCNNDSYIASKLIGLDNEIAIVASKIFPNVVKKVLKNEVDMFNSKIKQISELTENATTEDQLTLLNNLKKINESDLHTCKICTIRQINTYYKQCGHTICLECSSRVSMQCPFCKGYSDVAKLFI